MEPLKHLLARAWDSLAEGWRELLTRSSGALTHFGAGAPTPTGADDQGFPSWGLLPAETWETAQSLVIRIEAPGMAREDIDLSVHGNALRIRGEKRSGRQPDERHYHLMERAYGKFERVIPLPHGVDAEKAEVTYRAGVITVILRKTEMIPPRKLTVP